MHRRAVLVLVLAALVLALRLANLYAVFGPHVSRTPEGWNARVVAGKVVVANLSETAGGADAAAFAAGLRNGDVVREARSIRGEGGVVRRSDDLVRVRSTIRRGEPWRLLVERPTDGTQHAVEVPTVAADFIPGSYRSRLEGVWFAFVIPLAGLVTACLLGIGKPSNDQAFVGALMFIAFAATWEVFRPFMMPAVYPWVEIIWAVGYTYVFYLILHFFLIFPVRSALDRRMPWLRYTLLALLTVYLGARLATGPALAIFPGLAPFFGWLANATALVPLLAMAAVPVGLAAAAVTYGRTESRDARRRLGILLAATGGLFVAFTSEYVRDWLPAVGADWLLAIFGIVGFAFPVAFAYVVLTDRVFGIGLIIRRGLQYALVSRGFLLVELALLFTGLALATRVLRTFGTDSSSIAGVVAIGAGTIGIGAALMSLNASGMAAIDRRFFRDSYDATRILTELAHSVRHLVATPDALLRGSVDTVSTALHASPVAILLRDPSSGAYRVASQHAPPDGAPATARDTITGGSPFARYAEQVSEPRDLFAPEAHRELTEALGASAVGGDKAAAVLAGMSLRLLVPLVRDGKPAGLIVLGEKRSEEPYSTDDKRLLQSVADQLAVALGYADLIARMVEQEKIRRDVELAKQVQEKLFPQASLAVTTLDLGGMCRPAREIGGDYYDFVQLRDGCVGLAVGDISGKGIAAALLMASLQALLRSRAPLRGNDVAGLIADVNALLYESTAGNKYATFFYGLYDVAARTMTYVNAGHVPPIVVRSCAAAGSGAAVERLTTGGPVIGLFPELQFEQGVVTLCPGDLVVVCTDGVTEAMNAAGEDLGDDRLISAAEACLGMTAAAARDRLLAVTDAFVGDAPQHDDLTLVVAAARA